MNTIERIIPYKMQRRGESLVIREVITLNIVTLFILFSSIFSQVLGFIGGLAVVAYLCVRTQNNPKRALYIFFGIKFLLDAFWFLHVNMPLIGQSNLLVLSIIPLLLLILFGPSIKSRLEKQIIILTLIYLGWVSMAMVGNGLSFDFELLTRQSGMLIGLLVGTKFIKSEDSFHFLIKVVFISTMIPVAMSIVQLVPGFQNFPIFHFKMDRFRSIRYSGLYYDSATSGMVNIISFLTNAFLLQAKKVTGYRFYFQVIMLLANLVVAATGGTRSILLVMGMIIAILFLRRAKNIVIFAPILLILFYLTQPFFDGVMKKSSEDIQRDVNLKEIFQETENRTMFTGRVGVWQDILNEVDRQSFFQQMFGTGKSSNAHSTYIFLIMQIGWLGMVVFCLIILYTMLLLLKIKKGGGPRLIALLALFSFILIGFSLTTIVYTTFQWIIFLLTGSVLSIYAKTIPLRRKLSY